MTVCSEKSWGRRHGWCCGRGKEAYFRTFEGGRDEINSESGMSHSRNVSKVARRLYDLNENIQWSRGAMGGTGEGVGE